MEERVYQRKEGFHFFALFKESVRSIYTSRFLAKQLAVRDIKAKYRKSYFGMLWDFLGPLSTAFIWIFLNSSGTVKLSDTGIPYPIYAFTGTLLWSMITESINLPTMSTLSAQSILTKVNFPKEALVVSGIYKLLFNSSFKVLLLIIFIIAYGVAIDWTLILFPFVMFAAILFGITIGLFLTPISMLYTDVKKIVSFILRILMYATPVVFAVPSEGVLKYLMEINPITFILTVARDVLVGGEFIYLQSFFITLCIAIPLFFIGMVFYRVSIPIIVERLQA